MERHAGFTDDFYNYGMMFVFLEELHALQYPQILIHHRPIVITQELPYISAGIYQPEEEVMTDSNVSTNIKAEILREKFRSLVNVNGWNKDGCYEELKSLGDDTLQIPGIKGRFKDNYKRPLRAQDILPQPSVVRAMHEIYIVRRLAASACRPLRAFIEYGLAA